MIDRSKGIHVAEVVVLSPPRTFPQDMVTVSWDEQEVFGGHLPENSGHLVGIPVVLMILKAEPGVHKIEVRRAGEKVQMLVTLQQGERHYFRIFGVTKDGKEVLLQDCGVNLQLR